MQAVSGLTGKFIALEGLDGSGQSTQISLLTDKLKKQGHKVLLTKEPTNNIIGGLIRGQLTKDWQTGPECLQLLFAADRAHHLEREIIPALKEGYIVITDRYFFSTIAFGGIEVNMEWLQKLNEKFPVPDLSIFLQVPPEVCLQRMQQSRFQLELFEDKNKLQKVLENYGILAQQYPNIKLINGNREISEVAQDIYKEVEKII